MNPLESKQLKIMNALVHLDKVFDYKTHEELAREFINKAIENDDDDFTFEDIRTKYIEITSMANCPTEMDAFWKYVCKMSLNIIDLPRDIAFGKLLQASKDITTINSTIEDLQSERMALERQRTDNGFLNADQRYKIKLLRHYEEKNAKAKSEITDYIGFGLLFDAKRSGIKTLAHALLGNSQDYSYSYARKWRGNQFSINQSLKFGTKYWKLPANKYDETIHKLAIGEFDALEFTKWYISSYDILENIKMCIRECHFLDQRKLVLEMVLKLFETSDYLAFKHIMPAQIEGIFNDCCIEVGISEKDLEIASLNDNLDYLNSKIYSFPLYEYFSFYFPVIRNAVAHGKNISEDNEQLAHALLMDFESVCEFASSPDIPMIESVKIIRRLSNYENDECDYGILENTSLLAMEIPAFYDVAESKKIIINRIENQNFWESVANIINIANQNKLNHIEKSIKTLINLNIAKENCIEAFREIAKLKQSK